MGRANCLSPTNKGFKNISAKFHEGLDFNVKSTDLIASITDFAAMHSIDVTEAVEDRYQDELLEFLRNEIPVNKTIDYEGQMLKDYAFWYGENEDILNKPIDSIDAEKLEEIDAVTDGAYKLVHLKDGKQMVVVPKPKIRNTENSLSLESVYKEIAEDLGLNVNDDSVDKAETFLLNYVKTLLTSPRDRNTLGKNKEDAITFSIYGEAGLFGFDSNSRRDRLIQTFKRVFGTSPEFLSIVKSREELIKNVNNYINSGQWVKDLYAKIQNTENNYAQTYRNRIELDRNIAVLSSFLRRRDINAYPKEEQDIINDFLANVKDNKSVWRALGFKIQQLKKQREANLNAFKQQAYILNAIKVGVSNRLLALRAIPNINDLLRDRIIAEYDALKDKNPNINHEFDEDIKQYELHKSQLLATTEIHQQKNIKPYFSKTGTFTLSEIIDMVNKSNPEFKELMKLISAANFKDMKITVDDKKVSDEGGVYYPRKNEIVYHQNSSDIYAVVHELIHAATSYTLVGAHFDGVSLETKVEEYMNYIRNYYNSISKRLSDITTPGQGIFSGYPAEVYAFTNPAEFLAEVFSNPELQKALDMVPAMEEKKFNSIFEEIWDAIVNFFNKVFGKKMTKTALDQAREIGLYAMRMQSENLDNIRKYLEENTEDLPKAQQSRVTDGQTVQPKRVGKMTFSYGTNKRSDVGSKTTFDAILHGERTATTRYASDGHIDYWKELKVGDVIQFESGDGRLVNVRVTKPLIKLTSRTSAETWSKKEGWSVDYYNREVKPKVDKGQAYQFEYEVVATDSSQQQAFTNHSGGAVGSDSYWGEVGEKYGVKSNHYYHGNRTPNGNVVITEEQFEEGKEKVLLANKTLKRNPTRYMDLLSRNWQQVKNADAIFAVSTLKDNEVAGGTGWAVQMAIDAGKPVYVFDQEREQWYKNVDGKWSKSEVPTLTPNFAGIGTRNINSAGKRAIEEVYQKTFDNTTSKKQTSTSTKVSRETKVVQPTAEQHFAHVQNMIDFFKKSIVRDENFKENHKYYYVDNKGKRHEVPISVTSVIRGEGKSESAKWIPAFSIGNTFDAITRDFFLGKLQSKYPNISITELNRLKKQLEGFNTYLGEKFSKKNGYEAYKIITEDFGIGGYYTINGKKQLVAGSMDMLVAAVKNGKLELYIYDMKTNSSNEISDSKRASYKAQLNMYRALIEASFPEFKGAIKGLGIIECNVDYDNVGLTRDEENPDQVLNRYGNPIQIGVKGAPSHITYTLKGTEVSDKYIQGLPITRSIDGMEIEGFDTTEVEEKEEKGTLKKGSLFEKSLGKQKEAEENPFSNVGEKSLLENVSELSSSVSPLTAEESSFIATNVVRLISYYADLLKQDDSYRQILFDDAFGDNPFEESYFRRMKRSEILNGDVFNRIVEYIKNAYFDNSDLAPESSEYQKIQYVRDNFAAIVNLGFAEFVSLEHRAMRSNNEISLEDVPDDVAELYDIASREVNGREAYAIDPKTVGYMGTLTTKVKRAISIIPRYERDENGKVKTDENGNPIFQPNKYGLSVPSFENKYEVVNTLLRHLHGYKLKSAMKQRMKELTNEYPWMQEIIDRLDADAELATQFFVTMRRSQTNYLKTYTEQEDNVTIVRSMELGAKEKTDNISNTTVNNIMSGDSELFIVNNNRAGTVTVNKSALEDYENLYKTLNRKRGAEYYKTLKSALSLLGFNIDALPHLRMLSRPSQESLAIKINNTLGIINKILKDKGGKNINLNVTLGNQLYSLSATLQNFYKESSEISYYADGKNYMAFTYVTELQSIIEDLSGETMTAIDPDDDFMEDIYQEQLNAKYGGWQHRYNGIGLREAVGENVEYISSWLNEIAGDTEEAKELRKYIKHVQLVSSFEKPYMEQNDSEYLMSLLASYAAPSFLGSRSKFFSGRKDLAVFRVPTLSDKPSAEGIQMKRYGLDYSNAGENFGLDNMKKTISDKMLKFGVFELKRMRNVLDHIIKGDTKNDIEIYHPNRNKVKDWIKVNKNGKKSLKKLTFSDFVENGQLKNFIESSGLSFKFVPMFNWELENKTEVGQAILDYLNGNDNALVKFVSEFDRIYQEGMEEAFQTFIDENGLFIDMTQLKSFTGLSTEQQTDAFLQEYFWNDSLATANIINLTVNDLAFFKNSADFQKRFAQEHASTIKVDVEAEFFDTNLGALRRISDGKQRFVYIEDPIGTDAFKSLVEQALEEDLRKAEKEGLSARVSEIKQLLKTVPKMFDSVNMTDGQAFGSPTGFWKKLKMLGDDNINLDNAIEAIKNGDYTMKDFDAVIQAFKPFVHTNVSHVSNGVETKISTQIKDSEAMIALSGVIGHRVLKKNNQLRAIYEIMEESHWRNGEYQDNGIDVFAFHSTVKTGAFNVLDVNNPEKFNSYEEYKQSILDRIYINGNPELGYNTNVVHETLFSDWGKQQEVPEHMQDHYQGLGSQMRILSVTGLPTNIDIKVNGKRYTTRDAFLKDYFKDLQTDFQEGIERAEEKLGITGTKKERDAKLSKIIVDSIVKDSKYSMEQLKAFTLVNGKFILPLGDPSISGKAFSAIFSTIKKLVNDEIFPGGPVVQRAPWGLSDDLQILKGEDGGYIFEAYVTPPSKYIEEKIAFNPKRPYFQLSKKYQIGEYLTMEDILANGILKEEDLNFLANRIPTEDKYSMFRCKIKGFLNRKAGEYIILPTAITTMGGMDFDVDKLFTIFNNWNPKEFTKDYIARKNRIFNSMWASIGYWSSRVSQSNPGNFDNLKELAAEVNPEYKQSKRSFMYPSTQMYYRRNNKAGKEFVGIAALYNVSHCIWNMAGIHFKNMVDFTINGKSSQLLSNGEGYLFDGDYSVFDGSNITRTLSCFVGAAADNAKDPVLGSINITPTTATLAMGMLRIGVPLRTTVYMMSNPVVRNLVQTAELSGKSFERVLYEVAEKSNENDSFSFTDEALLKAVHNRDEAFEENLLKFLRVIYPYCSDIANINRLSSLNSAQHSVGPTEWDTVNKELAIESFYDKAQRDNSTILEDAETLVERVPFLKPLIETFDTTVGKVAREFSPLYQPDFRTALSIILGEKLPLNALSSKNSALLKNLFNSFVLFKMSKLGLIDSSENGRIDTFYKFPLQFTVDQPTLSDSGIIQSMTVQQISKKWKTLAVKTKATGLSTDAKNEITSSWEDLVNASGTKAFTDKLLSYYLQRFGFTFMPDSAISLAPNAAKIKFKHHKAGDPTIASVFDGSVRLNSGEIANFVKQWMRHNNYWFYPKLSAKDVEYQTSENSTDILIPVESAELMESKYNNRFTLTGKLYEYSGIKNGMLVFKQKSKLGIPNQAFEFDANTEADKMSTVFTAQRNTQQLNQLKSLTSKSVEAIESEEGEGEEEIEIERETEKATNDEIKSAEAKYLYNNFSEFEEVAKAAGIYDIITGSDIAAATNAMEELYDKYQKGDKKFNKKKYQKLFEAMKQELCI